MVVHVQARACGKIADAGAVRIRTCDFAGADLVSVLDVVCGEPRPVPGVAAGLRGVEDRHVGVRPLHHTEHDRIRDRVVCRNRRIQVLELCDAGQHRGRVLADWNGNAVGAVAERGRIRLLVLQQNHRLHIVRKACHGHRRRLRELNDVAVRRHRNAGADVDDAVACTSERGPKRLHFIADENGRIFAVDDPVAVACDELRPQP